MPARSLRIRSSEGHDFDLYLATPQVEEPAPAIVIGSAIHGVDEDLRAIADAFASRGYIAAAPDLFWRTVPGPLPRGDARAVQRAQPRLERIRTGERDLVDVLAALRREPLFNGRAAVMGFCYSGPYAIVGPKRLGYDAGIACHGTQMLDFLGELEGIERAVCVLWGDEDALAPAGVRDAYRLAAMRSKDVRVHVFPGVGHGYMMRSHAAAFDDAAYASSMETACAVLASLRGEVG